MGDGNNYKGIRRVSGGDGTDLCLDCGGGYTTVYIHQNSQNFIPERTNFYSINYTLIFKNQPFKNKLWWKRIKQQLPLGEMTGKELEGSLWVMGVICILKGVQVTHVYAFVKPQRLCI